MCAYYQVQMSDAIGEWQQDFNDTCSEDPICPECLDLEGDQGTSRFRCMSEKDLEAWEGMSKHCVELGSGCGLKRGTTKRSFEK